MVLFTQDILTKSVTAAFSTALVMGVGAAGMNYIGLAQKITGHAAPRIADAAKYGLVRGAVTFGVSMCAQNIKGQLPQNSKWSKLAISVGALAVLYLSVPKVAQFVKSQFKVSVHERHQYLALFGEGINFYFTGI